MCADSLIRRTGGSRRSLFDDPRADWIPPLVTGRGFPVLRKNMVVLVVVSLSTVATMAAGQTNLHHQGVVAVNGERFTGLGAFRFAIVQAGTDGYLWISDGSVVTHPQTPANGVALSVVNGVYSLALGDTSLTNMTAIPPSVFDENESIVLRVWFDDQNGNGTHVLTPDVPINPIAYALHATVATQLNPPGSANAAVFVANGGNVGVGTDQATERLTVEGTARVSESLEAGSVGIGVGASEVAPLSFASTLGDKISLWGSDGEHYGFGIQSNLFQIHGIDDSADIAFGFGESAAFTENMRIGGDGRVGIGTNSPQNRLDVGGSVAIGFTYAGTETAFPNGMIVQERVGIGTPEPVANKLHVSGSATTIANTASDPIPPSAHVAYIENTRECVGACFNLRLGGLAIKSSYFSNPSFRDHFLTFFGRNDVRVGSIRGNNAGGISFVSGAGDYAEWLPKLDEKEPLVAGDIVGIHAGRVSKSLDGADHYSVISTAPIIEGNYPGDQYRETHVPVVFIGQAPVRVTGFVSKGDVIVVGDGDGVGRAVSPGALNRLHAGQVVGRAWTASGDSGVKKINVGINLGSSSAGIAPLLNVIEAQSAEIESLKSRIEAIERRIGR